MEQYQVTGMSCAACSARVEKAVSAVEGVTSCSVNMLTNSMIVEGTATPEAIVAAVIAAGYGATKKGAEKTAGQDPAVQEIWTLRRRLIASLAFLAVLMYLSMGHTMWGWPLPDIVVSHPLVPGGIQLLLAATVMAINNRFFVSGVKALWKRSPTMDTLVALGSLAAFVYSTAALFLTQNVHDLYFESAAMIPSLITVGKLLEAHSKGKTTDALRGLMQLAPKTATLVRDGKETIVAIDEVRCDDIFVVRPGDSIPVDGIVLEGGGAVDESALTGESLPVDKAEGDAVSAATLNRSGFLKCKATRVGEDTALAQIIRMVSDAAASKAPIAKMADKVAGVFVPAVIVIAAITTMVWLLTGASVGFALARGIAVLVISCPCALGLATPVAIMVGSGKGARHGLLFKTAESLEQTGKAGIVVLDKTGTVTAGEPHVTVILPAEDVSEAELLLLAASLESPSEHPLARAVREEAAARGVKPEAVTAFEALPGNGVAAVWREQPVCGGSVAFIDRKAGVPAAWKDMAARLAQEGNTPLLFMRGETLVGLLAVADIVKDDSAEAVREMHRLGLRVVMLTGDNERTARAVGTAVGVDEVIADVLPSGKEAAVAELKKQGRVIMVGDGINDAPALMRADIGMAIGAGTDVAIDAADVVLVNSRLMDAVAAIRLSRATLRNIKENLFWAFAYNMVGIPLAAGVFIPLFGWELEPMFGALAMSLSSFCVVSNALRLNLAKLYPKKNAECTHSVMLTVDGMMCGHCEAHVKQALEAVHGVQSAEANHQTGKVKVVLTEAVEDAALIAAVEAEDYAVIKIEK